MVAMSGAARAFLVAAAGAAAVMSAPASAATYNNFNGKTGTYGDDLVAPAGDFSYIFTFTLPRSGTISSTISSSLTDEASNIDFSRVRLTGPNGFSKDYTPVSTGAFEIRLLAGTVLQGGDYFLDVQGKAGSAASYAGVFNFSAVPEPATWGLMILGFGAVGGAMRRRQSVKARVAFA